MSSYSLASHQVQHVMAANEWCDKTSTSSSGLPPNILQPKMGHQRRPLPHAMAGRIKAQVSGNGSCPSNPFNPRPLSFRSLALPLRSLYSNFILVSNAVKTAMQNAKNSLADPIRASQTNHEDFSDRVQLTANTVRVCWYLIVSKQLSQVIFGSCADWKILRNGESILPRSNSRKRSSNSREGMQKFQRPFWALL